MKCLTLSGPAVSQSSARSCRWLGRYCGTQRDATAACKNRAIKFSATAPVVDAITVALIEAAFSAEPPNAEFDEPWKAPWISRIEAFGVDTVGNPGNDVGATTGLVAARAVWVRRPQFPENTCPVKPVVYQRVDHDHRPARSLPALTFRIASHQQSRKRHVEHFVPHTVNVGHGLDHGLGKSPCSVTCGGRVGFDQSAIKPADKIAIRNVTEEKKQAVSGLIQTAIAQIMSGQATAMEQKRL